MMKKSIFLLGFLTLFSCHINIDKNIKDSFKSDSVQYDSNGINTSNLNGTWGLTNYFDSIIAHKELAKYRLQTPTWFAILLEIENDSLKSFGSIEHDEYVIKKSDDTLTTLKSNVTGDQWYLIRNGSELKLIQCPNSKRMDVKVYIYRKRDDFNYFTKEQNNFYLFGNNVSEYFNQELFEGSYINTKTNQLVVFGDKGKLIWIEGFDSYEVRNYFGTSHPFKNLDVITFSNSKTMEKQAYNWKFSNDELILTKFVYEKITDHGETYEGDDMVLGKEKIKLKSLMNH